MDYILPVGKVLCLRTCHKDLTSHGGFQWSGEGEVRCPDWSSEPECGHGLHGLLWGQGNGDLLNWSADAVWLVVEVDFEAIVDLGGKVKFPVCRVVYSGDRRAATDLIHQRAPNGTTVVGVTLTGGKDSILTGGYGSTLTGGNDSTLTGGDGSTLTGGNDSILTGGKDSILTGGYGSTLTFRYWDESSSRNRIVTCYPGEDGIEVNQPYRLDRNRKPVKVVK